MAVRVAINGFGRIGRNFLRAVKQQEALTGRRTVDFVAINDLTSPAALAHLLKYDSVHGRFGTSIKVTKSGITVDGDEFVVSAERNPAALKWAELGVDIVIESTGFFTDRDKAALHLEAGATSGNLNSHLPTKVLYHSNWPVNPPVLKAGETL